MAIKVCRFCGSSRTIQPYNSSMRTEWTCTKCQFAMGGKYPLQPVIIHDKPFVLLTATEYRRVLEAA